MRFASSRNFVLLVIVSSLLILTMSAHARIVRFVFFPGSETINAEVVNAVQFGYTTYPVIGYANFDDNGNFAGASSPTIDMGAFRFGRCPVSGSLAID